MFMASNHIHLIRLWASSEKTHLEILVFCHLLYYILLHSFALLLFLSLVHLLAVKFWPQSNKPYADLSTCFIFHHSQHFLIVATWNARTVNYRVVTLSNLSYLQHHHLYPWSSLQFQYHNRDCQRLWGEALLYQYFHILVWCYCNGNHTSDSCRYQDTHSTIYQLIKHEFCLLCVDCEEVYMKHCVMLNPLTPMSDQGRMSPNNINTISIR